MKRFTETSKWNESWFRKLKPKQKCLWIYLCDLCDHSGVLDIDWEAAEFMIGDKITEADMSALGVRVQKLPNGKLIVPKFIKFQYGTLSRDCKPHNPVFLALDRNGLTEKAIETLSKAIEGNAIGFQSLQEEEKEKVQEEVKDRPKGFSKPSMDEVRLAAAKTGLPEIEADKFHSYYESNGWRVGKNPMRSWIHALSNWKSNWQERRTGSLVGKTFAPSCSQQVMAARTELQAVESQLKAIHVPQGPLYDKERAEALSKRAPLIEQKSKLVAKLSELNQMQLT